MDLEPFGRINPCGYSGLAVTQLSALTESATIDDVKENLRLISEQVDRASKIIRRMRELTRRSERMFTPVDINNIIRESADF